MRQYIYDPEGETYNHLTNFYKIESLLNVIL
jgi:hypothetical protein